MTSTAMARLKQRTDEAVQRLAQTSDSNLKAKATPAKKLIELKNKIPTKPASLPGIPQQAELPLVFNEVIASNEYMTAFTRIPVFIPVKNRKKYNADPEVGEVIETAWGRIRRFGAGLNIYDEDTLMGLMHCCRQRAITGKTSDVYTYTQPKNGQNIIPGTDEPIITVHYGESSLYDINRYLGRGLGGCDYKKTRDSIRRLSRVVFEIEYGKSGEAFHANDLLFKLINKENADGHEPFKVMFQPLVTELLATQLTYVDMNVRMQLSDLGKAVHRFLSSQFSSRRCEYKISTRRLYEIIGYQGEYKAFMRSLRSVVIPKLIETGWLKEGKVAGRGRPNDPHVLYVIQ